MNLKDIKRTPVLLLTGYLGSGKTTLVNHILNNKKGIRFAVIVNDIGEVNIDADLIQKGGIVGQKDESLVALQNGCICCTLKMDLIEQIQDILKLQRFDYIVIEASGICEPEPIARTICSIPQMGEQFVEHGIAKLDCITTVVDAWRMQAEFNCGDDLNKKNLDEEDIENLLIQQIEFCNIVLLNKVSEVKPEELERVRQIILQLNPTVKIIESDYAKVDLEELLYTGWFNYGEASGAAGWIQQIERMTTEEEDHEAKFGAFEHHDEDEHEHHHHHDDDDDDEHEHHHHHDHDDDDDDDHHEHGHHHHHHHDHDHEEGEAEEYGIGTFVYYRRQAFDIDKFDRFVNLHWPKSVIRAKGVCYFSHDIDMSYLFEQAGKQMQLREAGQWYATMPENELLDMMTREPLLVHDWDEDYGDRMAKIVFIGQKMDKEEITRQLDECLVK
ncbi:MAG: GTP-binding protein [Bacteroidales bacterium]|nr:GTP-binding protein [Bacteroidales bacterium]